MSPSPDGFLFRKPRASDANGACFSIADNLAVSAGVVALEDDKLKGKGPRLIFPTARWANFIRSAKNGEFGPAS